jgi:hypothetical protein
MLRWVVFVALLVSSSFVCVGCGGSFWRIPDCIPDPNDPFSCPATPEPTDPPPPPPDPGPTPGCVDDAYLLFPAGDTVPSNYAGTMYLAIPAGETAGSFLAIEVGQTNPSTNVAQFEIGTQLAALSGPEPSFAATPPPGFAGVYTSSNLPLVPTWGTGITVIDTRSPAVCYPFTFAPLNVKGAGHARRRGLPLNPAIVLRGRSAGAP